MIVFIRAMIFHIIISNQAQVMSLKHFLMIIFRLNLNMVASGVARKGMSRILDGIMKYRQTLRPTLLDEFRRVGNAPAVNRSMIEILSH